MKTTLLSFLLFFSTSIYSQTSDILIIPDQNSLIATYKNYSPVGFYLGGYYRTSYPQPYIFTTPFSILNRGGILVGINKSISVMGGAFLENFSDSISLKPDVWLKINPLRIISKKKNIPDFSIGFNYMDGVRFGFGLSIPIRGIY